MMKMKKGINLILLFCLAVSLLWTVSCSKTDSKDWVGTTPLEEALSNGKPTIAEFGAATCVPCKAMKPVLEEIVAEHDDKLNLSFIDVRNRTALTTKYKISLIPTQVFFDSVGQELTRHVGFWPKEDVLARLEELGFL